jgi:Cys-tRNA(Pro)/Cys-tRNA(Cys) deacylase
MASRQTPATKAADAAGITFSVHAYDHDPQAESYAGEAAAALDLDPARVFKTLVVQVAEELVVCVVPATGLLDLKAVGKRAAMADPARAQKVTGYVVGGISPLGSRRPLRTLIDASATAFATIYVSAGRRGLELELSPADLVRLTKADVRELAAAA